MFGIGGFELFIILIFGFLIFGPEKLPEIAKTVGKGIARFRQAQDEMNSVIKSTDIYDPNSDEPFKDPMQALDKLAQHQEEKRRAQKQENASGKSAQAHATADAPSASASPSTSTSSVSSAQDTPRQESFTERKARYERERAARKAAEEAAAKEAGAAEGSAAGAAGAAPTSADGQAGGPAKASISDEAADAVRGGDE